MTFLDGEVVASRDRRTDGLKSSVCGLSQDCEFWCPSDLAHDYKGKWIHTLDPLQNILSILHGRLAQFTTTLGWLSAQVPDESPLGNLC